MTNAAATGSWRRLLAWVIALALVTFSVLGAMTIGLFVAPFALAAVALASVRTRTWSEPVFGGLLGVASVCLFVAFGNLGSVPCPSSGSDTLGPGEYRSCGGLDPMPWLTVGLLLAASGLGGYLVYRRAHRGVDTGGGVAR